MPTRYLKHLVVFLSLAALFSSSAAAAFDQSHAAWDALLKKHVVVIDGGTASRVDYVGFAAEEPALKGYLATLSGVSAADFQRWTKAQQIAFLLNAYNAFTIEKVLTRYPHLKSIRDFGLIFGNPWRDTFFTLFGSPADLDDIENMLRARGRYDEPRIHFALNCASIGCPMLRPEAYVAARLDAQLDDQARRFLSDRTRNRYDPASGKLEISRIFDWSGEDWQRGYTGFAGTLASIRSRRAYLARYAKLLADTPEARAAIVNMKADISFLDYDWSLNDVRRAP